VLPPDYGRGWNEPRCAVRLPMAALFEPSKKVNVRSFVLGLMVLVGLAQMTQAAVERVVQKSLPVAAGTVLKIDTCQGVIRIEPSADNQIHVLVRETMDVENEAAADRRLQDLDLQIEQVKTLVSVRTRYRRAVRWAWESWPPVALAYVVQVPRSCSVDLVTPEGDITVCALEGEVIARTGNGAIFVGEVKGNVRATNTRGDVSVTACSGELNITAKSGNVLVGRSSGLTKISASGGLIEVQSARGNLHIEADGADIKAGFVHPLTESSELRASGGDIEVVFDQRSACTLSARASTFGMVKSKNLTLVVESGKIGSSSLVATLNGGGPKVVINSSGGNVRLTGSEP